VGFGEAHDVRRGQIESGVVRRDQRIARDGIAQLFDTLDPARDDRVRKERARDSAQERGRKTLNRSSPNIDRRDDRL